MSEEKNITRTQEQNPGNTPVKNPVDPKDPIMGDIPTDYAGGVLNVFIGTGRKQYEALSELIEKWFALRIAQSDKNSTKSQLAALQSSLDEYTKQAFPDLNEDEVDGLANRFFNFNQNFVESEYYRHRRARTDGWSNLTETATDTQLPEIRGIKPGKDAKQSMRDAMRRGARRSKGDAETISVMLRNSFIHYRMSRPTILELSRLVQDINNEIRGYVRRVNASSVTLARISIIRVLWRFVADRITWCSVKDTQNYYDLAKTIRFSDVPTIAMALINAVTTRGIDMQLEHHNGKCNWSAYKKVDPALMIHHHDDNLKPEQAAALGNIFNMVRSYSREEIEKLQLMTDHGVNMRIHSEGGVQYLELRDPSLEDCFIQFESFVARILPNIQELRANLINDQDYEAAVTNVIDSVSSSEYVHWIDKQVILAEEGSDEEPRVFSRADNPQDFAEGIIDVITEDPFLGNGLIRTIRNHVAEMTFTLVGVPNFVCEKCKKDTAEDNVNVKGITPVDAIMAFFIHTQLTIAESIRLQVERAEEALSISETDS